MIQKSIRRAVLLGGLGLLPYGSVLADEAPTTNEPVDNYPPIDNTPITGNVISRKVEKIPFKTITRNDPKLPKGQRKTIRPGVEGEREIVTTQDTTTVQSRKPADIVIILDGSTSMRENYKGSLQAARALVNSLSDDDRIIVAMYTGNTSESYIAGNNGYQGAITKAMTKAEALSGLEGLGEPSNARGDMGDFLTAFSGSLNDGIEFEENQLKSGSKIPIETLIEPIRRPNTTLSIAQFTDGWESQEAIDSSFVEYAKANAKTFMSVVFPSSGQTDMDLAYGSAAKMTAVGHPNVYRVTDRSKVNNDVIAQFKNTALDVVKSDPKTITRVTKNPVDEIVAIGTYEKPRDPVVTRQVTPIKYTIREVEDDTLVLGLRVIQQHGVDGYREVITTTTPGAEGEPDTVTTQTNETPAVEEIVRVGVAGEVVDSRTEPIPFVTEIIEDETLPEGTDVVTVEGMTGEKLYRTTYKTIKGKRVGDPIREEEYVTKHMRTKIVHRGVKSSNTKVERIELPYETKFVKDPTMLKGERKVVQVGKFGEKTITRTWTTWRKYHIGDPTSVVEAIVRQPVEEIIHIGTREDVMDVLFDVLRHKKEPHSDLDGTDGGRAHQSNYSIADGKRISEITTNSHLLRTPIDDVPGKPTDAPKPKETVPSVALPNVTVAKPSESVVPSTDSIRPSALSVLRRTQKSTIESPLKTDDTTHAIQRLFQSLKSLSIRRWK